MFATWAGGAEGTVHGLEVVDAAGRRIALPDAGKGFREFKLAAQSSREIDFNAPAGRDFTTSDKVVVRGGKRTHRIDLLPSQGSFWDPDAPTDPGEPS